jgi:polyhydroxyalkanoate synthesis repressor PhaR
MSEPRVIKKYPNRRLYDTAESRYITLSDVRKLVVDRIDFVVIDKKTQEDITRSILLQVIAEQEHGADPVMSRDFLSQIIRSYGGAMQGVLGSYLEQSVKLFTSQQRELRDRVKSVVGVDPVETVAGVAQRNYQRWRSVQDEIFKTLMSATGRGGRDNDDKPQDSTGTHN